MGEVGTFPLGVVINIVVTLLIPGPGVCIGLLSSKTGPTAIRGQFYGIAAATGKIGAFVGTWGESPSTSKSLIVSSLITLTKSSIPAYHRR